jgi:hypothetical protein
LHRLNQRSLRFLLEGSRVQDRTGQCCIVLDRLSQGRRRARNTHQQHNHRAPIIHFLWRAGSFRTSPKNHHHYHHPPTYVPFQAAGKEPSSLLGTRPRYRSHASNPYLGVRLLKGTLVLRPQFHLLPSSHPRALARLRPESTTVEIPPSSWKPEDDETAEKHRLAPLVAAIARWLDQRRNLTERPSPSGKIVGAVCLPRD